MYLTGLGTATPASRYTQKECWAALVESPVYSRLQRRSKHLLERILHRDNGIRTRYLAASCLGDICRATPDSTYAQFQEYAPELATQAGQRALLDAGLIAAEIDAVIVSTCTGYLCPGLSSYVVERLGLRTDVIALDLVGQGCAAALPNWMTADALLGAQRATHVLSVCVEVCSAAFYLDDDPGVLISACLFGDGAGAAVLSAKAQRDRRAVRWLGGQSILNPAERDALRFEQVNGMLRNILTQPVPRLAADHAAQILDLLLTERGLSPAAISTWIWHAGGRDVLLALQDRLNLGPADTRFSWEVLAEHGNLSSAFVFFVLQAALDAEADQGYWWLSSFGAGFSCHGALLEVT